MEVNYGFIESIQSFAYDLLMVGFTAIINHHPLPSTRLIMVASMSDLVTIYAQKYEVQILMHLPAVDMVTNDAQFYQCE